jgi:hypothetical protein
LVKAESILAGDKFELVLVGGAHDRPLAPADRTVAPPEVAYRPMNLEPHRAAMACPLLYLALLHLARLNRDLWRCVILRCHALSPLLSFRASLAQAVPTGNDIALSGAGFS